MAKDTILSNDLETCRPWIEAALEYTGGTHNWEDVVESIAKGTMQLWAAPRGCIVTEIVVYPRKKVLNIFFSRWRIGSNTRYGQRCKKMGRASWMHCSNNVW